MHARIPQRTSIVPFEAAVWLTGLVVLYLLPETGQHFDACLIHRLGLGFCPGCGLGRSIQHFLHGAPGAALAAHPLGPFAVAVLVIRSVHLIARRVGAARVRVSTQRGGV